MRLLTTLPLLALSSSLHAQVYRCGNTYSSAPCAGGNAQYMDWIANERKQSRDQQFRMRC